MPTRALIQQVETDLRRLFASQQVDALVTSMPSEKLAGRRTSTVFVLTQERLSMLLNALDRAWRPNVLIVDEAQKVGDGDRGVLLENLLQRLLRSNGKTRVLFASPLISNPELFVEDAPPGVRTSHLLDESVLVSQNLLWACQKAGKPLEWGLELFHEITTSDLGEFRLLVSPTQSSKRLPFVAFTLGAKAMGNLVYVNTAADAEKTAKQLYDLIGNVALSDEELGEIAELQKLIRATVHPQYSLADVVVRRIAFHYGNMPLLVRTEIERLFKKNVLWYLVCTSTLIEGVNLPCKNVFVRGPTRGLGTPMSSEDFWNLAGRAGRWGKEFQGNIICVDARNKGVWKTGAPTSRTRSKARRHSEILRQKSDELLAALATGASSKLDGVLSFLLSVKIAFGELSVADFVGSLPQSTVAKLDSELEAIRLSADWLDNIVLRNPGVSVFGILSLYKALSSRASTHEMESLIPSMPDSNDAVDSMTEIFKTLAEHLTPRYIVKPRAFGLALIVVEWMRGFTLPRIIDQYVRYLKKNRKPFKMPAVIRGMMQDVEQVARFEAPKMLGCYTDVLKVFYSKEGRDDLVGLVPDFSLRLEFGVTSQTQVALISLGLGRSTAISVSELMADDQLDEPSCRDWLRQRNWMTSDLPAAMQAEIQAMLET